MSDPVCQAGGGELVSVVIPVFNGERHLGEALESVRRQTHPEVEVIVVDDGSTDRSVEIARAHGGRMRLLRQANEGTASARNRGVRSSRGAFLAFLDQDDRWEPDKLSLQVRALRESAESQVVFGMVRQFISPEMPEDFRKRIRCPAHPVAGYLPSVVLLRREAFFQVGFFSEQFRLGEWADWYVRHGRVMPPPIVLPQVVAWRRLHGENKGLSLASHRAEYAAILRTALARRRANPSGDAVRPAIID